VDLIDDHGPHIAKEMLAIGSSRDENRLKTLGRREQDVRRISQDGGTLGLPYVAMPQSASTTDERAVKRKALVQVVQQSANRTDVQHAQTDPFLSEHSRKDRQDRGFRFAASGWGKQKTMFPVEDRVNRLLLQGPQITPAEAIDNMMLDARM
jgi:hypothetical protein